MEMNATCILVKMGHSNYADFHKVLNILNETHISDSVQMCVYF